MLSVCKAASAPVPLPTAYLHPHSTQDWHCREQWCLPGPNPCPELRLRQDDRINQLRGTTELR